MDQRPVKWSQQVTRAREALGMTVQQLAHHLGVRPSELGAIERGQLLPDDALAEQLLRNLQLAAPSPKTH